MKKILLSFSVLTIVSFTSCSKDNEQTDHSLMANVYYQYPGSPTLGKKIASPTLVLLYDYDIAVDFDKTASVQSVSSSYKITLADGTTPEAVYSSSPNFSGINTFEKVKDGKYMLIAFYKPEGYSWPMFYYYGYKEIVVNEANNAKLYTLIFDWNEDNGKFVAM